MQPFSDIESELAAREPQAAPGGRLPASGALALLALTAAAFLLVPAATAAAAEVTVELDGGGTGTVTSFPAGIDCANTGGGTPGPSCDFTFAPFATVSLTATPAEGFAFAGWSGSGGFNNTCASPGIANPCSFVSASAVTVTATFEVAQEAPEVELEDVAPGDITATEATFHGAVDPNGSALSACRFEWVPEADPDGFSSDAVGSEPCDPDPGDGDGPVEVEATATDLEPNTAYRVRLLASKATTDDVTDEAPPFTTGAVPPSIVGATAIPGATMATLRGRVDPRNSTTSWRLEYRRQGAGEWILAGEGDAGDGNSPVGVVARALNLNPETAYEFRLLAESEDGGPAEAAQGSFETGAALPARAFEVASPVPTGGVNTRSHNYVGSDDGDRVMFETIQSLPGVETFSRFYVSARGDGGWSTQPVDPGPGGGPTLWVGGNVTPSADLSPVLVETVVSLDPDDRNTADPDEQGNASLAGRDLYLRQPNGEFVWISRDPRDPVGKEQTDPARAVRAGSPFTSSMTADGSVVVFSSLRQLVDEDTTPTNIIQRLYKWADGELSFLGERPDGSVATQGSELGDPTFSPSAVSRDGSRVVVKTPTPGGGPARRTLYVHEDGEPIVEPIPDLGGVHPRQVAYAGADRDVSRIFFTSASRLTPDSGASHSSNAHSDLYAFDVDAGVLRDLTPRMDGLEDPEVDPDVEDRARVLGVAAFSDDGRRVYFVADGQLPAEPSPLGEEPSAEGRNLYLAELDGIDDEVPMRFVASLGPATSTGDEPIWDVPTVDGALGRQAHASPDGSVLAIGSVKSITGQPTAGQRQAYVYDDDAGTLACASCPGDGSPPAGEVSLSSVRPGTVGAVARQVSSDGTVFFHTPTPLVASDINQVDDVYEYGRGELRLVSAGTGSSASRFADASADGSTVFFRTRDALAPQDDEPGVAKVYAARVGGGFAAPPPPPPPCFGDGCQGRSPIAPHGDDPGSSGARGPANLADNRFSFGNARKNRRRGTANLTVEVPGSGELELDGNRKLKPASKTAAKAGEVRLKLNPKRKAMKRLRRKGRVQVTVKVTFSPEGGEPNTKQRKLKLVKKRGASTRKQGRRK